VKPDIVVGGEDMKPSEALASNRAAIRRVVESHRACNARVFGSVLRGQDTDSSDLDILIDPTSETTLAQSVMNSPSCLAYQWTF
jgi:predicted nucleotidyltransferase